MPNNTSCSGARLFICWNQMVLFAESRQIFSLSGFYWTYDTFHFIIHAPRSKFSIHPTLRVESLGLSPSRTINLHANPKPVRQILVSLAFNMFLQITKHTPGRYGFSVTCLYWSLLLFLGWFTASVIPWSPETDIFTISFHNGILKKK